MLIFIEYSFNGEIGRICYEPLGYDTFAQIKADIPNMLKQDNIIYDSWHIRQILEPIKTI